MTSPRKIAVAGGTGLVGRYVVAVLRARGHEPVVLARSTGVDLTTGAGLDRALDGCAAVVDVSNVTTTRRAVAEAFFDAATTHLVDAAARAGAGHLVALSIVGIDDVDLGYYAGKRRQEQVVRAGAVPWTVLRATQFHEFAGQYAGGLRGPVVVVPSMLSRPVAAQEVADRLVGLATGLPLGDTTPIAGPATLRLADMVRGWCRATGRRALVVPVRLPGAAGRAAAGGALVPAAPFDAGTRTFGEYLSTLGTTLAATPGRTQRPRAAR
jgi:uncharacterized protein YbjT (DUF2867 family)